MSREQYWIYFKSRSVCPALVFSLLPDLKTHYTFHVFNLPTFPVTIPSSSASIQIHNALYVTGGQDYHDQQISSAIIVYSLNPADYSLQIASKPNMACRRMKHAIASIGNKYIYIVGGYGEHKLSSCEKFVIGREKWVAVPSLNVARVSATACYVQHYIYVVGGCVSKRHWGQTYFERLDVNDEEIGWTLHTFKAGQDLIKGKIGTGALSYSPFDILIFGGAVNTPETINLRFDTVSFTVKSLNKYHGAPHDEKYRSAVGLRYKEKVYAITDCTNRKICWLLDEKYWTSID
eukprot:TRINITY_DN3835_c0_g4_i1.p1 TRINITY_DN3835_c0_g4~~TRINITY_DN3835_c0_g4_i1.p1  ORF type:complete len:291 (-),score=69.72 TRINITY_DN3835_c0_g4_i1:156-1028(-)